MPRKQQRLHDVDAYSLTQLKGIVSGKIRKRLLAGFRWFLYAVRPEGSQIERPHLKYRFLSRLGCLNQVADKFLRI